MSDISVGIYLGSNNCTIALWRNGKVDIIPNDMGERTTPSFVSFTKHERLVGQSAEYQKIRNPQNTIYGIREIIGKKFDDPDVEKFMKKVPFKIEKDLETGIPKIIVEYLQKKESFFPEEIYAMIIQKLIKNVRDYSGRDIKDAIIAVPSYFNSSQREAIRVASKISGVNVIRIVNKEIALYYAYELNKKNKNILVFHMGSNETNVTILNLKHSIFEIKGTVRDDNLGGNLFVQELAKYCTNQFKEENGIILNNYPKGCRRLEKECEKYKKKLSTDNEISIDLDALAECEDFCITITRTEFEVMCKYLFDKIIPLIEKVLEYSSLTKNKIDEIILTGGSMRIPKIQKIIKEFFNGKELNMRINPDEVYAYGAAILAANLNNEDESLEKLFFDEIPLSLGIDKGDGIMDIIVLRNTLIPFEKKITLKTINDSSFNCKIYEGERKLVKYNKLFLEYIFDNISKKKKGEEIEIEIIFEMDINYYLLITFKEIGNDNKNSIKIKYNNDRPKEEIEKLIEEGKRFEEDDKKEIEQIKNKLKIENYSKLLEEIEQLKKKNKDLQIKNDTLNEMNKKKEKEIEELNNKLKMTNKGYNEINKKLIVLMENKRKLEKELNNSKNEKDKKGLEEKMKKMNNEYNEMKKNLIVVLEKKKKLEGEIEKLKKK